MRPEERAARAAAYERGRPEVGGLVPAGAARVLDLGCATGATGAWLKARAAVEVVGVEREPEYARDAAVVLDRVLTADVEALATDAAALGRFDALIAADVLEHLVDPWRALRAYAALLEPGGTAVVSLPNVAHWSTYAALARGSWPRRPEGIHDRTHLRWFTLRDARELLAQAGLRPITIVRRPWLLWRGSRLDRHAEPLMRVPVARTLFCFQHVIAARR